MDPLFIIILGISLLVAITIHEAAHAFMSDYLGDPTARLMGRLSLNPLVHLDPMGTLVFVITAIAGIPFGWGKPVQFDPYNLQNPKKDAALISLAGPASNIILASILSLIYRFILPIGTSGILIALLQAMITLNISLAIFNLIPIHPLDGGKILVALLPENEARQYDLLLNRYGFMLLLFLIIPIVNGQSIVSIVISPIINFFISVLIPGLGVL
ncbi:site-2 protease family protein [soil metagenome]